MKKLIMVAACLLTAGCTVTMTDKRLPPEQVAAAFQTQDKALKGMADIIIAQNKKILEIDRRLNEIKPKKAVGK